MKFITEKCKGIQISEAILKLSELEKEDEQTFTLMPRAVLILPKNLNCMDMLLLLTNLKMMYEEVRDDLLGDCEDAGEEANEEEDGAEEAVWDYAVSKACEDVVSHFKLYTPAEKTCAENAISAVFDELIEMGIDVSALFAGLLLESMEDEDS